MERFERTFYFFEHGVEGAFLLVFVLGLEGAGLLGFVLLGGARGKWCDLYIPRCGERRDSL